MATEAIISDIGAIYKRLFHHRPVVQNEVHLFVREFEMKRGNSDLQCLQSCVSMVNEMEAVFLEDIASMRPHFKAIHSLSAEVAELGNQTLRREKEDERVGPGEQEELDRQVEEFREEQENETREFEARVKSECQRLGLEIRETRDSRLRLRTVSVGSSAGLSLSLNGSTSENGEGGGEEEEEEEEEELEEEEGEGGEGHRQTEEEEGQTEEEEGQTEEEEDEEELEEEEEVEGGEEGEGEEGHRQAEGQTEEEEEEEEKETVEKEGVPAGDSLGNVQEEDTS